MSKKEPFAGQDDEITMVTELQPDGTRKLVKTIITSPDGTVRVLPASADNPSDRRSQAAPGIARSMRGN